MKNSCFILLGLAVLAGPLPVAAQAEVDSQAVAGAREAFAEAQEAFARDRYEQALDAFRRAYRLAPHDSARFNIAVCLEELGRFREAAVEYDAVAQSDQLDDEIRGRARSARQVARVQLATLVLRGANAALQIQVDGATACATPCEAAVDPGEHMLSWVDGSGPHERRIDIELGGRLEVVLGAAAEPIAPASGGEIDLGVLGAIGIGLVGVGGAGIIGFGIRAADIHDQYLRTGCGLSAPCDEGELARDLSNASIGVAIVGVIAIVIDLAFVDD